MSKITFRADDDLVERLEERDASKSEAMRRALRAYLGDDEPSAASDRGNPSAASDRETSIDDLVRDRVDELLADRLDAHAPAAARGDRDPQDVNVTVSLEGEAVRTPQSRTESHAVDHGTDPAGRGRDAARKTSCAQCGEHVDGDHVYCPNCGEKASKRLFCDCGDELRSDWSFCPGCGRRTPAADVLGRDPPE